MFVLVATFCLGLACHEAEWPVEPTTAIPHNCLAALNSLAPDWLATRPGYTVRKFKCVPAERLHRDV